MRRSGDWGEVQSGEEGRHGTNRGRRPCAGGCWSHGTQRYQLWNLSDLCSLPGLVGHGSPECLQVLPCVSFPPHARCAILPRSTFGIDFFSVLSRGSQYRVESLLVRLAHTNNYIMPTPSREQVSGSTAVAAGVGGGVGGGAWACGAGEVGVPLVCELRPVTGTRAHAHTCTRTHVHTRTHTCTCCAELHPMAPRRPRARPPHSPHPPYPPRWAASPPWRRCRW